MPGRDGTGPVGAGSMTGRGLGFCNDAKTVNPGRRPGMRLRPACRRGFGRGYGMNFGVNDVNSKKELLQNQKSMLQNQINLIDKQLKNL
ncbi:MAG TPA: DUF5320 domain-containing protein [Clostridiaceae bacterium]|nr:DUF5320 domain-containing protein [Clostridiaceae bacterium]